MASPATAQAPSRELEIVTRRAAFPGERPPLLFVHGINVGAWVWEEHFLDFFAEAGFDAHALSLRGHGGSWGGERIEDWRLADYVADLEACAKRIGGSPVLVGHSLGGAVVQKFMQRGGRAAGMALLASVPPWGLAFSAFRMGLLSPRLFAGVLAMSSGRNPRVDRDLVREALFSPDLPPEDLERFAARVGRESPRIGPELQGWPPFAPPAWAAPPTVVLGGLDDRIVPADEIWRTGLYYGCGATLLPKLGHALMLEPRWRDAAAKLRDWLLWLRT